MRDPLFSQGDFFDSRDTIQVKYEMLRRVRVDGHSIADSARAFGFSRPSFYQAQHAFDSGGLPALLPKKPGPHGGHKLGSEVVAWLFSQLENEPGLSSLQLAERVAEEFALLVHPRSIERALARQKKMPIGFVYDQQDRVVLDADQQVQDSVRLLFKTYFRTGAAHATLKHFRQEGLLFPNRLWGGSRKGELTWSALSLGRIAGILHNPWYAGVYAFGRSRCKTGPNGKVKRTWLPHSEWQALLRDNHPGYISWEEFVKIEQRLFESGARLHFTNGATPPREGPALLQGRAICGVCGQRMHVRYGRRRGERIPITSATVAVGTSEMPCVRAWSVLQRYMLVDPRNRLVADSLEAGWNDKLRALDIARDRYEQSRTAERLALSDEQHTQILALTNNFGKLWHDPKTPHRERKRMLGLLIDDVTIVKQQALTLGIRFRGSATTTLTLKRPMLPYESRITDPDTRKLINELADKYNDTEIAHLLNERALTTGAGSRFDGHAVRWVRKVQHFRSYKQRLQDAGWLTASELSGKLGVSRSTLRKRHCQGSLRARMCTPNGQWLYWPPDRPFSELDQPETTEQLNLAAKGAV